MGTRIYPVPRLINKIHTFLKDGYIYHQGWAAFVDKKVHSPIQWTKWIIALVESVVEGHLHDRETEHSKYERQFGQKV